MALILCCYHLVFAQNNRSGALDSSLVKKFRVDFAVPDLPAFKLLGTEPSNLLRPSTTELFSVITSNFYNGTNLVVPQSFAAEISPMMLMYANKLTLQEYDRNAVLYSLRLSIGTMRSEGNNEPGRLSVGLRVSLIDEGDLKNDQDYRDILYNITYDLLALDSIYQEKFMKERDVLIHQIAADSALERQMKEYIRNKKNEHLKKAWGESVDERLANLRKEYKTNNWNKQKLDVAYALLGETPDSLLAKIKFSQHAFWLTYSHPIADWGQWLIGGNCMFISDSTNYISFSLASRVYFGTNRIKGFLEAQYQRDDLLNSNNLLLNLGSELNLFAGIWINFYAGLESLKYSDEPRKSQITSHFDVRFTIPEKFDLF